MSAQKVSEEEPLDSAFERLSSAIGGDRDWGDDEDDEGGLPPAADLFEGLLPDDMAEVDEIDVAVSEMPEDAPLVVSMKNCPTFLPNGTIHKLFEGLEMMGIQTVRHKEGKQCFVEFSSRHHLALALHRNGKDIGHEEIELGLAYTDPDYHPFVPEPAHPPPQEGRRGPGPAPSGPQGSERGPDPSGRFGPGPPGGNYGPGPPRGGPGPHGNQGPHPPQQGRYQDRGAFDSRPNGGRDFGAPPGQFRGGPGGYGGPPPQRGQSPPRIGGFQGGPPGQRRMSNEFQGGRGPPRYDNRHGPGPGPGPGPGYGHGPGYGFGGQGMGPDRRMGPPGGNMSAPGPGHPPDGLSAHPSGPPPSERPRLKLAPRTKPIGQDPRSDPPAAGVHKPNPFGSARPIDTATKLKELETKDEERHRLEEKRLRQAAQPHKIRPDDPVTPEELHSALVDPPSKA